MRAPQRAQYWRASTLDTFVADRWIENLYPVDAGTARGRLPTDPLVPDRDRKPGSWLHQQVTIDGYEDDHVVAAGAPALVDGRALGRVSFLSGGVMRAATPVPSRDDVLGLELRAGAEPARTRRVAAAVSRRRRPVPGARSRAVPRVRQRGSCAPHRGDVPRRPIPAAVGVPAALAGRAADHVARRARRTRRRCGSSGGSAPRATSRTTSSRPGRAGLPPLVDFVERTRAGYCQHFAGAMTVMLRMLGVPARVAVGFTAGTWKGGVWTVTDYQAHAWVEAWFAGYGWLTFDPTPGRGTLSAVYTLASDSADAVAALGTGRFLDFDQAFRNTRRRAQAPVAAPVDEKQGIAWWIVALPVMPLAAAGLVVGAKLLRRERRLRRHDPRRLAWGVRAELVDALVDRGLGVDPNATVATLQRTAERALATPCGSLGTALSEARYGPADRAEAAARRSRDELVPGPRLCALA